MAKKHKDCGCSDLPSRHGGASLSHQTETGEMSHSFRRGRTETGAESRQNSGRQSRRRLNPQFCDWLMGAPVYWTIAAPIGCAALAMASWRSRQRARLECLLGR